MVRFNPLKGQPADNEHREKRHDRRIQKPIDTASGPLDLNRYYTTTIACTAIFRPRGPTKKPRRSGAEWLVWSADQPDDWRPATRS